MRAEFYIAQVLRWNPQLRERVYARLGLTSSGTLGLSISSTADQDPGRLMEHFRDPSRVRDLAWSLRCEPADVFHVLRNWLAGQMGIKPKLRLHDPSRQLGPKDVRLFFEDEFIARLASLLHCPPYWADAARKLFDQSAVLHILYQADIALPDETAPADELFGRMVSADGIRKLEGYYGRPIDIWDELLDLVSGESKKQLCECFGCVPEDLFVSLAAQVTAETREDNEGPIEDGTQRLDMVGVACQKAILRTIAEVYLNEARDVAKRLTEPPAGATGLQLVGPLLDYYGREAYADALRAAKPLAPTVGSLVRCPEDFKPIAPLQTAEPDTELRAREAVKGEQPYVAIEFRRPAETEWRSLLHLYGLNREWTDHLVQYLPRSVRTLQGAGDTLMQKVQTCPLPPLVSLERQAWELMTKEDNALIRYFVLSGARIPDEYQVKDAFEAVHKLPAVEPATRTVCPSPEVLWQRILHEEGE